MAGIRAERLNEEDVALLNLLTSESSNMGITTLQLLCDLDRELLKALIRAIGGKPGNDCGALVVQAWEQYQTYAPEQLGANIVAVLQEAEGSEDLVMQFYISLLNSEEIPTLVLVCNEDHRAGVCNAGIKSHC